MPLRCGFLSALLFGTQLAGWFGVSADLRVAQYLVVYTSTGYRLPATSAVCNVRNVVGGIDVQYYY